MSPFVVRDDATVILTVWTPASDLKMQDITLEQFQQDTNLLGQLLADIDRKEAELIALRNQRDDLTEKLNNACMRARAGVKSYFGDNSTEYELVGGTRASDRKRPGPAPRPRLAVLPTAA